MPSRYQLSTTMDNKDVDQHPVKGPPFPRVAFTLEPSSPRPFESMPDSQQSTPLADDNSKPVFGPITRQATDIKILPPFPNRRSGYLDHIKNQSQVMKAKNFITDYPHIIPSRPQTRAKSAPNLLTTGSLGHKVRTKEYTTDTRNLYYTLRQNPGVNDHIIHFEEHQLPETPSPVPRFPTRGKTRDKPRPKTVGEVEFRPRLEGTAIKNNTTIGLAPEHYVNNEEEMFCLESPNINLSPSQIMDDRERELELIEAYNMRTGDLLQYYADKDCFFCQQLCNHQHLSIYQRSLMSQDEMERRLVESTLLCEKPMAEYFDRRGPRGKSQKKVKVGKCQHKSSNVRDLYRMDSIEDQLEENNAFFKFTAPAHMHNRGMSSARTSPIIMRSKSDTDFQSAKINAAIKHDLRMLKKYRSMAFNNGATKDKKRNKSDGDENCMNDEQDVGAGLTYLNLNFNGNLSQSPKRMHFKNSQNKQISPDIIVIPSPTINDNASPKNPKIADGPMPSDDSSKAAHDMKRTACDASLD